MKKRMLAALLLSALLFTLSGCGEKSLLNKKEPVSLTFWHVYGEQAGSPMDLLVQEFNRTVGQERGVQQGKEYAILTDEITKAWSGMTTRQYKKLKGLKKENLRDNMSTMEIVLNMLAEATTTELSKAHQPEGFSESQKIARRGGSYAGQVRQDIEKDTGRPVITSQNAAQLNAVVVDMIESVAETEKPDNDENK